MIFKFFKFLTMLWVLTIFLDLNIMGSHKNPGSKKHRYLKVFKRSRYSINKQCWQYLQCSPYVAIVPNVLPMLPNVPNIVNVANVANVASVASVDNVDNVDNIDTTLSIDTVQAIWNNNPDGFWGYTALMYGLSNMGLRDASASKNIFNKCIQNKIRMCCTK